MKTTKLICFILFLGFYSFGQNQKIQLKLEEGYEYIFEKIDKNYSNKKDGTKLKDSENKLVFRIAVEQVETNNTAIFTLNYKECWDDRSIEGGIIDRANKFYPPFNEYSSASLGRKPFDPVLIPFTFRFKIDLQTGEITFENRAETLIDIHSRLKEKKYTEKEIKSKIEFLNERGLNSQIEIVEFLTWFINETVSEGGTIVNTKTNERFVVNKQEDGFLAFGDQDFSSIEPGRTKKKFQINLDNGLITNYSTLKIDSVKSRTEEMFFNTAFRSAETSFRLVYSQQIPSKKIYIAGKIENPLSENIHIRFLNEPFGTTLKTNTVLLNEDNSFQTSIDFLHNTFVYIENENKNKFNPPGTYVFYAEPGDTISFISTGSEFPWETTFGGSNVKASELLHSLRMNIKLSEVHALKNRSNLVFDQMTLTGWNRIVMGNGMIGQRSSIISDIFNYLEQSEKIVESYKSLISKRAYNFISDETKAYFYSALYENALLEISRFGLNGTKIIKEPKEYSPELTRVGELDIHKIYKDYGLHSRLCVGNYINYNFARTNKISKGFISMSGNQLASEIDLKTQFSRMVLTGSSLYRELGKTYQDIIEKQRSVDYEISKDIIQGRAIEGMETIIQLCNDNEIVYEAQQIVNQSKRLENENYVPALKMLDLNGSTVTYENMVKGKPTIFCFSTNWIGDRYEVDQLALKNTDLRFVFVVEGSNLEQWQQYTERAVPDAEQLLYINDKQSFCNIFHEKEAFLIFDKEGKFLEYGNGIKSSISIAQKSLQPQKKELNKSQLQIIILILLAILTTFVISIIIWKWRVRQRFRKEALARKLKESELTAIRSQMNPHFLFNSLNSVQNLVQQNKGREAHLYLSDFAGLIRKVLNNSEKEEVSLAEELEMIRQYLNLEKLRFDFDFEIEIDESVDQYNTLVPSILLQPFVENAVIHGLQNKADNRQLKVGVSKDLEHNSGSCIKITIEDNGIGRAAAKEISKQKNGKGTRLMKERLEILRERQGENYSINTFDLQAGTCVEIVLPEEN